MISTRYENKLQFEKIIKNKLTTIIEPTTPNSSHIIENIKSVCGSGK